jgi:hypothetical protein
MCATKNDSSRAREIFASKKEIYLLCRVFSIRPEDNKAGFRGRRRRRKKRISTMLDTLIYIVYPFFDHYYY